MCASVYVVVHMTVRFSKSQKWVDGEREQDSKATGERNSDRLVGTDTLPSRAVGFKSLSVDLPELHTTGNMTDIYTLF